jgi:hypothetical protein
MAHNLHGDIPSDHLKLAKELEEMEEFFDHPTENMPKSLIAKGFVCCAHDWYEMGDDEKGNQLLEKAEKVCPGYFENEMLKHVDEDELFDLVVLGITKSILTIAAGIAGDDPSDSGN